jgi:hypothetical protein
MNDPINQIENYVKDVTDLYNIHLVAASEYRVILDIIVNLGYVKEEYREFVYSSYLDSKTKHLTKLKQYHEGNI